MAEANAVLRSMFGPKATFRPGQYEAIEAITAMRKRVLVVQQTGWGKSLVYFIATKLLREGGAGPTLLISPLLALMRNQVEMAQRIGIRAESMASDNTDDWPRIEHALAENAVDLLMVSPERLGNARFVTDILPAMRSGIGLLVVDEAHCISDWGHDFRPDYRRIVNVVRRLPANIPLLGTTATANTRVIADIEKQLGPNLQVQRGPLARSSLRLQTISLTDQAQRLAWLAQHIPALPGTGIIYCLTVRDCERVSGWLARQGIDAPAYHGQLQTEERKELESRLLGNDVKALVATVALGMGFDKPDLGFVVHYQRPGSVVAYYQQVGRAGRSVENAYAILLEGREDNDIQDFFIGSAFPSLESMALVLSMVEQADSVRKHDILAQVNLSQGVVEKALKLLEIDGALGHEGPKYYRTANPWTPNILMQEQVTRNRRQELDHMQLFMQTKGCLMEYVARELDDPFAAPCGKCSNCSGDSVPRTVDRERVLAALTCLGRDYQTIKPRKQWPAGGIEPYRGAIKEQYQLQEGRALSLWGDPVWGELVRLGKYINQEYSADLVEAAARLIRESWRPTPTPTWVTAVPSLRAPKLVKEFARQLAGSLALPFFPVLTKIKDVPAQKSMQNGTQQAKNAIGAFAVQGNCPNGSVLLVDDVVDSRWTLTICGVKLREAGSGPVFPLALAVATPGGSFE